MEIIDLTLPLYDGLRTIPFLPRIYIDNHLTHNHTKPLYDYPCQGVSMTVFSMVDHCGTHVDAPVHYLPGGKDISEISLEKLVGNAVLIDASKKSPNEAVTADMLVKLIKEKNITIKHNHIVIIRCSPFDFSEDGYFECKSLDLSAAEFLIQKEVKAVGVDTVSVDCLDDRSRPVHLKFLEKDIIPIETLANLTQITQKYFMFIALPLPLKKASGSPVRAIALVNGNNQC